MSTYYPASRAEKANDKMQQGQREAAEKAAAHAELIRRNKERNAEAMRPSEDQRQELYRKCDAYDPGALRGAVKDAGRRVTEALAETPALQALVDLIVAMIIEARAAVDYRENAQRAEIGPEDRKPSPNGMRDPAGRDWPMLDDLPLHFLPRAILEAARASAEDLAGAGGAD